MEAIHEDAQALFHAGAIDRKTMKNFDDTCLTQVQTFTAEQIKALRKENSCLSLCLPAI
jgi:putative transcriptional regulator